MKVNKRLLAFFAEEEGAVGVGVHEEVFGAEAVAGERDLDGKHALLHALAVGMAGKTNDEKIVGFIHDVVEVRSNFRVHG